VILQIRWTDHVILQIRYQHTRAAAHVPHKKTLTIVLPKTLPGHSGRELIGRSKGAAKSD